MTLAPLRWRIDHDAVLATDQRTIHRLDCQHARSDMTPLAAGEILERQVAPTACDQCRPDYQPLLGDPELTLEVVTIPMLDTGIGIEAGYADDQELLAAGQAERDALPPPVRDMVDAIDEAVERRILGMDDKP